MNRKVVETSEFQRMYGKIQNPADAHMESATDAGAQQPSTCPRDCFDHRKI